MSDTLRKEYTGTTGRSCFDTHGEPWPNYVYWLEASLLSEREKVARLTAENERMRKASQDALDLAGGCCCAEQYKDMQARGYMKYDPECHYHQCGLDDLEAALTPAPAVAPPTVCRWTWNDDPYPGGWRTSCKNAHGNIDGKGKTPVGVCPYCGLPIEEVKE